MAVLQRIQKTNKIMVSFPPISKSLMQQNINKGSIKPLETKSYNNLSTNDVKNLVNKSVSFSPQNIPSLKPGQILTSQDLRKLGLTPQPGQLFTSQDLQKITNMLSK